MIAGGIRQLQAQEYPRVETILGEEGDNATDIYPYSGFWGIVSVPEQNAFYFTRCVVRMQDLICNL